MRVLYALLMLFCVHFSSSAEAAIYTINLNDGGGVPGTAGTFFPPCQPGACGTGIRFAQYLFSPGDVVEFGTATFYSQSVASVSAGLVTITSFISGPSVSFNQTPASGIALNGQSFCSFIAISGTSCTPSALAPITFDLTYTIPNGSNSIQLAWFGPVSYIPPVPELSTWAMMIIGFAGIGAMSYHRHRRQAPNRNA